MTRSALLLSLILAAAPAAASAQATDVTVTIGAALQARARDLGQRDLDRLARDLELDIERAVARSGRGTGGRLELVLTDARPSRPTFEQMARRPGLSMESVSNGGAAFEGVEIRPDGSERRISFSWYETDIRWARSRATWTDAHHAFQRFARRYADGKL